MNRLAKLAAFAAVAALALVIGGCASVAPMLDSADLDMLPLVEQHDAWVEADASLEPDAVEEFEAESAALLELLAAVDRLPQEVFAGALRPVVDRYDAYLLAAWPSLNFLARRYLSRTSDLARDVAGLPLAEWPPMVEGE